MSEERKGCGGRGVRERRGGRDGGSEEEGEGEEENEE